jgi:ribosomal protein S12 methylthiotransferase accessory factor
MHRMTTSLREAPLEETIEHATRAAKAVGVTRVTNITRLDVIGIPVFASIRPDASPGSLCVHAGKGLRADEALAGACMEAVEFAASEFRNRAVDLVNATPRQMNRQEGIRFRFVDFCPPIGRRVDPGEELCCVNSIDIEREQCVLIPAELVFHPFAENFTRPLFGTGTNGLASGNTINEATVHALCEVIERDVTSFNRLRDTSRMVDLRSGLPEDVAGVVAAIERAGVQAVLRYTENEFDLPFFSAHVMEPFDEAPISVASGYGLHILPSIAATRALTEAVQSRLTHIHGGRDDIIERHEYVARHGSSAVQAATAMMRARITDRRRLIMFDEIGKQHTRSCTSVNGALEHLLGALAQRGIFDVLRVDLSPSQLPVAVVRVVVPKLEHYEPRMRRVGPRLAKYLTARSTA